MQKLFFLILFNLIMGFAAYTQNIALGKPTTFSISPNYLQDFRGNVTDGVYTNGHFWTSSTTLGWFGEGALTITIDLLKSENFNEVVFSTAFGQADVYLPKHIFLFTSDDQKNFSYLGDLIQSESDLTGTVGYQTRKVKLTDFSARGRYVTFRIVPNGFYVFADEIEVIRRRVKSRPSVNTTQTTDLAAFVYKMQNIEEAKNQLKASMTSFSQNWQVSSLHQSNINVALRKNQTSISELDAIEALQQNVIAEHGGKMAVQFRKPFVLNRISPWAAVPELYMPKTEIESINSDVQTFVGSFQFSAFLITNTTNSSSKITLSISKGNSSSDIEIYESPYVKSKGMEKTPDPLVPISGNIELDPGATRLVILKIIGKSVGKNTFSLTISNEKYSQHAKIQSTILNRIAAEPKLNAINWAYLTSPMLLGKSEFVSKDLKNHHVNTIVVPSHLMPRPGDYYFNYLLDYIRNFPEAKNVVLYSNYSYEKNRTNDVAIGFMSDQWKVLFSKWYKALETQVKTVTKAKLYLYPFDEVKVNEMNDFSSFAKWAKTNGNIRLLATFIDHNSYNSLVDYVEIALILSNVDTRKLKKTKAQTWEYSTESNTRALSPYSYYRLMGWRAYLRDYTGIGFWSYADIGDGSLNSLSGNSVDWKQDYAIVYNATGGKILSSRRWEAFKLGIEDYELLKFSERKIGIENLKKMVSVVVNQPDNYELAENIKQQIIKKISIIKQ